MKITQIRFRIHQGNITSGIHIQLNDHATLAMVYHPNSGAFRICDAPISITLAAYWNGYEYYSNGGSCVWKGVRN